MQEEKEVTWGKRKPAGRVRPVRKAGQEGRKRTCMDYCSKH